MSILTSHNVHTSGNTPGQAMVFAHGFGCDQNMWRFVAPAFEDDYRVVLFDYLGHGGPDRSAYDPAKYNTLQGYADDVVQIGRELEVEHGVFVGHSVSSMIGVLAVAAEPTCSTGSS